MITRDQQIEWILRVAIFGEFLGHGIFALQGKSTWIGWIQEMLGVELGVATTMLTIVGVVDVLVALAVLFWPKIPRVILLWAAFWGFYTALVRPIVGEPIWDFIERWANWGAPLALLLIKGWPKKWSDWVR